MFVQTMHPSVHAQIDFGKALTVIGRVEQKIHDFRFDLLHSDATCHRVSGGNRARTGVTLAAWPWPA